LTRDQAVARLKQGLGFRTDLDDPCANALKEAQRELEMGKTLPWFLLEYDQTLALASDANSVTLPTGYLRPADFLPTYYLNSESDAVEIERKATFRAAWDAYHDAEAGAPQVFVLRKSDIYFFPVADAAYSVKHSYYKRGTTLSSGSETNPWLDDKYMPEWLIGEAGLRLANDLRDAFAADKIFGPMAAKARLAVFNETSAREEAAVRLAFGKDL
jgi:hypothetical protein